MLSFSIPFVRFCTITSPADTELHFSLSSIIITRFLLNLREAATNPGPQDEESRPSFVRSRDHGSTSSLRFGSFVGNMGELLDRGEDEDDDLSWDNAGDDEDIDPEGVSVTGADVV